MKPKAFNDFTISDIINNFHLDLFMHKMSVTWQRSL